MNKRPLIHLAIAILLFIVIAIPCAAAGPGTAPQVAPQGGAGLVTVDFSVLGDGGVPILDLKPADVSLKIGGRARDVRSLQLVQTGGRVAADGTALAPLPQPFASNRLADRGRSVVIMLEDESIPSGRERTVKDAIGALLDGLAARDLVSLMVISTAKIQVGSTMQHDRVRTAIDKFVGRAQRSETTEESACRTQTALNALTAMMGSLGGAAPTTIVFMSGGLAAPVYGGASSRAGSGQATCDIRRELYDEVSTDAHKASVDLYAIYIPTDMLQDNSKTSSTDTVSGLENLAGATGNALIRLTGDVRANVARVARETSVYYLASFEPDAAERTGAAAHVELRVNRDSAKVRARSEVVIPKVAAKASAKPDSVKDMLRVSTVYRDLPIRAMAYPARGPNDKELKLVVLLEPFDPTVPFSEAAVGLFDDKGKLAAQWTSQPAELLSLPVMSAVTVAPGLYRIRAAATDAAGHGGTVDADVRIGLEKGEGPVQMSSLVLGTPVNGAFGPRLRFVSEDSAMGFFEVYGLPKTAVLSAIIEIAASPDGPALAAQPARTGVPTADGRRVVLGEIPITSLKPGEYVVRVVLTADGKPAGRVVRTLLKVAE